MKLIIEKYADGSLYAYRESERHQMKLYCHHFWTTDCCSSCHEDDDTGLGYMCDAVSPGRLLTQAYICCGLKVALDKLEPDPYRRAWADAIREAGKQ